MSEYIFLTADKIETADKERLMVMLEAYFDTEHDPEQMSIGNGDSTWIKTRIPECAILIKRDQAVIGSTLIFPCNLALRQAFIQGRLNEAQLVECIRINNLNYDRMQAIYLCSAFITPEHRGHNLAYRALFTSIKKITPENKKLPLFCWAYSAAGQKLAARLANTLGVDIDVKT